MSSKAIRVTGVAGVYVAAACGVVALDVYAGAENWLAPVYVGSAVPLWVACSWALVEPDSRAGSEWSAAVIRGAAWGAVAAAAVFLIGLVVGVNSKFAIGGTL